MGVVCSSTRHAHSRHSGSSSRPRPCCSAAEIVRLGDTTDRQSAAVKPMQGTSGHSASRDYRVWCPASACRLWPRISTGWTVPHVSHGQRQNSRFWTFPARTKALPACRRLGNGSVSGQVPSQTWPSEVFSPSRGRGRPRPVGGRAVAARLGPWLAAQVRGGLWRRPNADPPLKRGLSFLGTCLGCGGRNGGTPMSVTKPGASPLVTFSS